MLRGDRVIRLRKEQGLNQTDLAEKIGILQNQISRYERGIFTPPADIVAALAHALNTSADYLLGLSDVPHPGAPPDPTPELSHEEAQLIALMRAQDEQKRALGLRVIRVIWEK